VAGKEVAEDGLEMGVGEPGARVEGCVAFGPGGLKIGRLDWGGVGGHLRPAALASRAEAAMVLGARGKLDSLCNLVARRAAWHAGGERLQEEDWGG